MGKIKNIRKSHAPVTAIEKNVQNHKYIEKPYIFVP